MSKTKTRENGNIRRDGNVAGGRFESFRRNGRERYTVMIVPPKGARTWRFQTSLFSLFFVGFLSLGLLTGLFCFLLNFSGKKDLLVSRSRDFVDIEANLSIVKDEVDEFLTATDSFRENLASSMNLLTPEAEAGDSATAGSPELSSFLSVEDGSVIAEVTELQSFRESLDCAIPILKNMGEVYSCQEDLLKDIPSIWPLQGVFGRITTNFGVATNPFFGSLYLHRGVDIGFGFGAPIVAAANGTVIKRDYAPNSFGNYIDIQHKYGFTTRYAHLQRVNVDVGQRVSQGDVIGTMGDSGHTTGVHLHYEVWLGDQLVDPITFLNIKYDPSRFVVPALRQEFRDGFSREYR